MIIISLKEEIVQTIADGWRRKIKLLQTKLNDYILLSFHLTPKGKEIRNERLVFSLEMILPWFAFAGRVNVAMPRRKFRQLTQDLINTEIWFSEQFPYLFCARHCPRQDGNFRDIEKYKGGKN